MTRYEVIITKKADKDEAGIYKYILEKFGVIYAENFRKKLIEVFSLLSRQPFVGRPAKSNATLRIYILSKQNKIVYKVTEDAVVIIRLLNTKTSISGKF